VKLFDVGKVGCYLEAITHKLETRRDSDVKVTELTLRVQPFEAKLATALSPDVRALLFTLNSGEPKPILRRADVALGVPRQDLEVFASTDTVTASIVIDHVKITGIYARADKKSRGFVLLFKASFGPCAKQELEYVNDWFLGQRFVSFEPAERSLEFEERGGADDEVTEADEKSRRPAPMFDTDAGGQVTEVEGQPVEAAPTPDAPEPARKPLSHAAGRKKGARGVH